MVSNQYNGFKLLNEREIGARGVLKYLLEWIKYSGSKKTRKRSKMSYFVLVKKQDSNQLEMKLVEEEPKIVKERSEEVRR